MQITKYICLFWLVTHSVTFSWGQVQPPNTFPTTNRKDTTKTNTSKWQNPEPKISYTTLFSALPIQPDTGIHNFHHRPFLPAFTRDLGNPGSPAYSLLFTPNAVNGPSLGYSNNNYYRYFIDSLKYAQTTRPYALFNYQLGSKLEQVANVAFTQNFGPNLNVQVQYRKVTAPGYFKINRNIHDNASMATHYISKNKRFNLHSGLVYNKLQHDENGGIVDDNQLGNLAYIDRRTVDVAYQNAAYSNTRSTVSNALRDFSGLLSGQYALGTIDTVFNEDTTTYDIRLKSRFHLSYVLRASTEQHTYKDIAPDSVRYSGLFQASLPNSSTPYYVRGADSVYAAQKWHWADQQFALGGNIGSDNHLLTYSLGTGIRVDMFATDPIRTLVVDSLPNLVYQIGNDKNTQASNYLFASVLKEAATANAWYYKAYAKLFTAGSYAGNTQLDVQLGKQFKQNWDIEFGGHQSIGVAPYNYSLYGNAYSLQSYTFKNQSITQVTARIHSEKWRTQLSFHHYLLSNYLYTSDMGKAMQYNSLISMNQLVLHKSLHIRSFVMDNDVVLQQATQDAPINYPQLLGKHQLSIERGIFQGKLFIATGLGVQYHSPYKVAGYNALLNRFFYQNTLTIANFPEAYVYLNFSLKHFRAFIMIDQLQQQFNTNPVLFAGNFIPNFNSKGTPHIPVYVPQNTMLRLGFSWTLIN